MNGSRCVCTSAFPLLVVTKAFDSARWKPFLQVFPQVGVKESVDGACAVVRGVYPATTPSGCKL
jgi:hypothetical protein